MSDVVEYLRTKGVQVKNANAGNVHTQCFFCHEDPSKRGRLYIATEGDDAGLYTCFLCGEKGNIHTLRKHFGDPPLDSPGDDGMDLAVQRRILNASAEYYSTKLADRPDVLDYLKMGRGLTVDTILAHQIGWADGTLRHFLAEKGFNSQDVQKTGLVGRDGRDFMISHITIPYHVAGNVVMIRGRELSDGMKGGKYLTPPGQKARLFNTDSTFRAEEIILTEGEFDALVLEQLGYAAVGVPGANTWQERWNQYFSNSRRIFICFDNDPVGNIGAEKVARILGPKSRIVRMPEHQPTEPKNDPTEWIVNKSHTKEDFDVLLSRSKGGLLKSPDDALAAWREIQKARGLELGFPKLDMAIAPGLLPSQVMVVLAKSGVGKTVFLLNVFHRMLNHHPDTKILFVSLEQTEHEWFERARRIYRFYNPGATDQDCLEFYRDRFLIVDQNVVTEEQLKSCIEQFKYEVGKLPDLVAIDYLGYWARSFKGESYQRTSDAIMSLKAIAKELRIPILTPHQVSRGSKYGEEIDIDTARDSGVVLETADFMFTLWAPDDRHGRNMHDRTGEVKLKIGKSRHGGKGVEISMRFARLSLAMVPMEEVDLANFAAHEQEYASRNESWELAQWRHRTGVASIDVTDWMEPDGSLVDPEIVLDELGHRELMRR